ncbi:MAG: extracellular solute-binding protein [Microbacterium sp.]|uniref:ABC transporter substrate-binding protein n=1 Tax=Microbacterium sp. TaxID=51671 RepID=UPI0039E4E96A
MFAAPLAVGALVLAGCSGGTSSASGDGTSFSLSYAVSNDSTNAYKVLAEKYMEENPDVTITLNEIPLDSYGQTLTTQLNAGNASDVFQAAPGTGQTYSILTLADSGLIAPLDDAATAVIPSGSDAQFVVDGSTYGVALGVSYVGTVLNQTVADADGFTYPTTWSDLLSSCSSVSSSGKSVFALAGAAAPNTGLMALVLSATRVYADDPSWNEERADGTVTFADSQGWKDTLQAVIDMNSAGCFQDGVAGGGFDAITNGLVQGTSYSAFVPGGSAHDLSQAAPDDTFTIQSIPAEDGGTSYGISGADYALSLSSSSKNTAAATAFLDWAATEEGQQVFADAQGSVPVGSDLSTTIYAAVADQIDDGDVVPLPNSSWPNSSVYDALGAGVQGLLTGQMTIDQVLASMDTAWNG